MGQSGEKLATKKSLFSHEWGTGFRSVREWGVGFVRTLRRRTQSVADDRATMRGDHHVYHVATITETECHDLSAKNTRAAANQCRACLGTASWDTRSDFIAAAGARIFNAPSDCNGWGRFAANWFAAIHGCTAPTHEAKATRLCLYWGSERQQGHSHASCDQSTQSVHLSLSCCKVENRQFLLSLLVVSKCATVRVAAI